MDNSVERPVGRSSAVHSSIPSEQVARDEYRAYNQGYYRGKNETADADRNTRGFLIGAALVFLFGLGGLIAYLVLQKPAVNLLAPAPLPAENVDSGESESSELSQPDIDISITEPSTAESSNPEATVEKEAQPSSTPDIETNINVEAPVPQTANPPAIEVPAVDSDTSSEGPLINNSQDTSSSERTDPSKSEPSNVNTDEPATTR